MVDVMWLSREKGGGKVTDRPLSKKFRESGLYPLVGVLRLGLGNLKAIPACNSVSLACDEHAAFTSV